MVVAVMGILAALALPRVTAIRGSAALRASRQQVASLFSTARSAALQKGQDAIVQLSGSQGQVRVQTGLASRWVTVYGPIDILASSGVTVVPLAGAPDSVSYSGRGLLKTVVTGPMRYELRYRELRDTLCISTAGLIMPRGCQP